MSQTPVKKSRMIGTISNYHQLIHESKAFNIYHLFEAVDDDASANILIIVPDNKVVHLTIGAGASGAAEFEMFEKVSASNNGTVLQPINLNREKPLGTKVQYYHTPTISNEGSRMAWDYIFGATQTIMKVGGESLRPDSERVLNPGTNYLVRVTNRAGSATIIMLQLNGYEYRE